jgi:hypothetical protein
LDIKVNHWLISQDGVRAAITADSLWLNFFIELGSWWWGEEEDEVKAKRELDSWSDEEIAGRNFRTHPKVFLCFINPFLRQVPLNFISAIATFSGQSEDEVDVLSQLNSNQLIRAETRSDIPRDVSAFRWKQLKILDEDASRTERERCDQPAVTS